MEAISPGEDHTDSTDDWLPAYPASSARSHEDAAELAATGGALVTAMAAQRWNEASRTWLQRRIGASPSRQTREELTVRAALSWGNARLPARDRRDAGPAPAPGPQRATRDCPERLPDPWGRCDRT